jgi:hypothetical protein
MEQQQHAWQDNPRQRWAIAVALVVFVAVSRIDFPDPLRAVPFGVFMFGLLGLAVVTEVYLWRRRGRQRRESQDRPLR